MREIKFRAWDGERMLYFKLFERPWPFSSEWPVMQFTGMSDKNGKEIYEGDILGWMWGGVGQGDGTPAKSEVYFDRYKFAVRTGRTSFGWKLSQAAEVIGNIHENPELLEDK